MPGSLPRVGVGLALLGGLWLAGAHAPVFAQGAAFDCDAGSDVPTTGPTLVVVDPSPGEVLRPGGQVIRGAAFDCHADEGIGVDRVSVYLGSREAGGVLLGDATLGAPTGLRVLPVTQFASAGWTLPLPATVRSVQGPGDTLSVYARSTVTGKETVLAITVSVQEATAPAPAPAPETPPADREPMPAPSQISNPPEPSTGDAPAGEDEPIE
jgi:hypothetical protein